MLTGLVAGNRGKGNKGSHGITIFGNGIGNGKGDKH
jgi:hypothetical protein